MWTLVPENILPIIRSEWANIFPLGVTNPVPMPNGNPFASADRLAISNEGASKPRNYLRDFRFGVTVRDVIVRQSDIKWILPGKKIGWNKIRPSPRGRVVVPTIARKPTSIPGAFVVGNRIVSGCPFTYPEDRGRDVHLPVDCTGKGLSARGCTALLQTVSAQNGGLNQNGIPIDPDDLRFLMWRRLSVDDDALDVPLLCKGGLVSD